MVYKEPFGIIAGYGLLPELFVNEVKNFDFYIIGFKNLVSKRLKKHAHKLKIINLWSLSEVINFFKTNNVKKVVFLGYIPHKEIFKSHKIMDIKTNFLFKNFKTNSAMDIFKGILEEFEKQDIQIEPYNKYLEKFIANKGYINNLELSAEEIENINFGYKIAKNIANLDIGLTVVVKDKVVIAVEALEGTDMCILRAKKLVGSGCYVIKVARPNQDMRFDLPVIGPKTVRIAKIAKIKVIAVESGKTLILNKDEVIKKTKNFGIKLYGI